MAVCPTCGRAGYQRQVADRDRSVARSHIIDGKTFKEIGVDLGITGQRCRMLFMRVKNNDPDFIASISPPPKPPTAVDIMYDRGVRFTGGMLARAMVEIDIKDIADLKERKHELLQCKGIGPAKMKWVEVILAWDEEDVIQADPETSPA